MKTSPNHRSSFTWEPVFYPAAPSALAGLAGGVEAASNRGLTGSTAGEARERRWPRLHRRIIPRGVDRSRLMRIARGIFPSRKSTDNGSNFDVASDLDLAALIDTGWEISPPLELTATTLQPSSPAFTWKSSSFLDYKVERGSNLQTVPAGSGVFAGNGVIQSWTDPAAPAANTFYRLRATHVFASPPPSQPVAAARNLGNFMTQSVPPRNASGCYEGGH